MSGYTAAPRHLSVVPEGTDISAAAIGSQALSLALLPQGQQVAQVLEARREDGRPLFSKVVIQIPRRSTKTTAIQIVLLGRCFSQPGYKVIQTAQSQTIARRVFLDMIYALEAAYPDENNRPFKSRIGNGQESIRWTNGSVWFVVAPKASSMRSQAADCLWFDEAGEYSLEQTADLLEGALPLMDTRPKGQVIVSGTPAKTRAGLLWDFLNRAREGKTRYGIVDYSMNPTDDPTSEEVWWKVHAGLASGLTDIETIRERFDGMPLASFAREYLCADPVSATIGAIDPEKWAATQVEKMLQPPASASIAYATAPDGSAGAIGAAWYNDQGQPVVQLLDYRAGISWVPREVAALLRRSPRPTVLFDRIGNNLAVYQEICRIRNTPTQTLEPVGMKESAAGLSALLSALGDQNLVHAADKSLDAAAEGASLRYVNDSRLLGRRSSTEDVSPLEAVCLALYHASGKRNQNSYIPKAVTF